MHANTLNISVCNGTTLGNKLGYIRHNLILFTGLHRMGSTLNLICPYRLLRTPSLTWLTSFLPEDKIAS
jgi:hypothetical protein